MLRTPIPFFVVAALAAVARRGTAVASPPIRRWIGKRSAPFAFTEMLPQRCQAQVGMSPFRQVEMSP